MEGMFSGMGGMGMPIGGCGKGAGCASGKGAGKARERLTDNTYTGEIVTWNGTSGWIQPHAEIDHPKGNLHGGKVYVSSEDITGETVQVGSSCAFFVYSNSGGVGAEEVMCF